VTALVGTLLVGVASAAPLNYDFGAGAPPEGFLHVAAGVEFTPERGFGFEPGAETQEVARTNGKDATTGFVTSAKPFYFTSAVPAEGNYRVTVTLGDSQGESNTTVKAELRRLMIEQLQTKPGEIVTRSFIVNTRTAKITATSDIKAGEVKLKAPRESVQEAWAWDNLLTLEFNGPAPKVCRIEIAPAEPMPTIFLIGDSTVCDQSKEPFNSWGQMLPRFFTPQVAIANHAESGETYRDSIGRRRLDKILSVMKPGDYLIMQFGHNDQKQIAAKTGGPFTTYQEEIKKHVDAVRAHGGIPVIVSPMERRNFTAQGKVDPSLSEYAEASRQSAKTLGTPFIDLNAMSIPFYEALGPEKSAVAFAAPGGKVDNTHHDNYGSYELAKCIVAGLQKNVPALAKFVVPDFHGFDPAKPDNPDTFNLPASPNFTNQRPLGN
jgi:lysophospholipase L1-like esterase